MSFNRSGKSEDQDTLPARGQRCGARAEGNYCGRPWFNPFFHIRELSFPQCPTPVQWHVHGAFPDTSLISIRLAMESRVLGGKWLVIMIRSPASEKESWCG